MFLSIVGDAMERYDACAIAYCLMGNHYHLVIRTRKPNLSLVMRHINGVYTQASNRKHGRIGHVFQGRFHAEWVGRDAYLLEVCRYVELNPVRARLVERPSQWRWSSHRAHLGLVARHAWLDSRTLYDYFSSAEPESEGPVRYARFVLEGCAQGYSRPTLAIDQHNDPPSNST